MVSSVETIETGNVTPLGKEKTREREVEVIQSGYGNRPTPRQSLKERAEAVYKKYILELLLRQVSLRPSKDGRHIPLHVPDEVHLIDERRGHAYISNVIRSSRYTLLDFLPKQLLFQATRLSNFYFICIGVPQTIPGLSTTGSYTTILPLMFFMLLTIVKEGYDDYKRHRLDKVENANKATCLSYGSDQKEEPLGKLSRFLSGRLTSKAVPEIMEEPDSDESGVSRWTRTTWRNIRVGDVLKLKRDDTVPADIVLLYADGEDGIAYIETMALDGETNLKSRQAPSAFKDCSTIQGIESCRAEFVLEDPNPNLYAFNGRVSINSETLPLTLNEVIYRGSVLRNTGFIVGIVVNTGEECKIRMNTNQHPSAKKPRLEKATNKIVLTLVFYVVVLSVGCSMGYLIWRKSTEQHSFYLNNASVEFQEIIIGYAIAFNNVIPLALYVSLEIVKIGQMLLLNSDIEMYDEATDTPMTCNTNTILENLGQVDYILSDKTGTLTENVMIFRKMTISGTAWSHEGDVNTIDEEVSNAQGMEISARNNGSPLTQQDTGTPLDNKNNHPFPPTNNAHLSPRGSTDSPRATKSQSATTTADLVEYIRLNPTSLLSQKAREFILGMALCHACLPESKDGKIEFQGSSPDEIALVRAAQELGYIVIYRSSKVITLLVKEKDGEENRQTYEILDIIEFSSKRKRMSIILRCPDGRIWLICKGADSMILPRLRQAHLAAQKAQELQKKLDLEHEMRSRKEQLEPRNSFGGRPSLTIRRTSSYQRQSGTFSDFTPRNSFGGRPSFTIRRTSSIKRQSGTFGDSQLRDDIQPQVHPHEHGGKSSSDITELSILRSPRPIRQKLHRLDTTAISDDSLIFARSFRHIHDFATEGLRTLLFAHRFLNSDEYFSWKKLYHKAATSLIDRQEQMEATAEVIEQSLDLLGASAIEDKLQKGVPETIDKLRRANIRIWMLTGDKRETAINIAHSAQICQAASEIFVLDALKDDLDEQIQAARARIQNGCLHSVAVIDGYTLSIVEKDLTLKDLFYSLMPYVDSVICCRASPAQKASIVDAIRARVPGALTLAIGDGSNDIAMIQASHVGVGISGKEGSQASRVADYSIAQFRFLQRLLLVHGRWNYVRTAKFVLMTFWKEMFFYMMQALYQRYNGYTGTSLYESTSLTVLNTLFTSLCVIVMGIFEQDLSAETLLAVPELYVYGQRSLGMNFRKYLTYVVGATAEGVIVWFVCWAAYGVYDITGDQGLFAVGDLSFTLGIVWTNWKLFFIETHHQSYIVFGAFSITFAGWWAWNLFLAAIISPTPSPYAIRDGFTKTFGRDPVWWLTIIVTFAILATLELAYKSAKKSMVMAGQWPPWKRARREKNDNIERWHLELWQELEKDPEIRESLREMAHGRVSDVDDSEEVDGGRL